MRKALRLEGPVRRTGNRQEPPLNQVLAGQLEVVLRDPVHFRVREDSSIEVPPLPLRLPGQAEVAPADLGAGVVAPDQVGEADDSELQRLP